ncbi:MAG: hypothetical protein JWO80_5755 [Bryobacterales bacterium]|nr:hypothetical protein [Bryobacterales bacterium]
MKTRALILFASLLMAGSIFAAPITYSVIMNGPSESPPEASAGTGFALVTLDAVANTLSITETFANLNAGTTANHIHCCTPSPFTGVAGVATQVPSFIGFPLGVTSGSFSTTLDMTQAATWNPAFITASGGTPAGAEAVLVAGAAAGTAYLNIHTTFAPNGEIRGFLVPVPEPGTLAFAVAGLAGVVLIRRRR